jgi:hypothetical protein
MTGWAFNTVRRDTDKPPAIEAALAWLDTNTVTVSRLGDLTTLRGVLDQLALKMDGTAAAAKTVYRKRAVVFNALEYAVERDLLSTNRLPEVKWTAPKRVRAIDTRVVVNTRQGPQLLAAVADQKVMRVPPGPDEPVIVERRSSGPRLVACFGTMYRAGVGCWCRRRRPVRGRRGPTAGSGATAASSSSARRGRCGRCRARRR